MVQLIRESGETVPGENEWDPPVPDDPDVYTLDATAAAVTVDQANAKFIDGTVITPSIW